MIRMEVVDTLFVHAVMAALFTVVLSSRVGRVSRISSVSVMVRVRVSVK